MLALALALAALAGPAAHACPRDRPVVRDAAALREALDSDARDIWVTATVEGEFQARRALALHGCEGATLRGTGAGTVLTVHGDGVLIEDLTFEHSGARVSAEDGALKVSGKGVVVRRVAVRDSLYGIALERCQDCLLERARVEGRAALEPNQRGDGIKLWEAHGSTVRQNQVTGARDVVVWYSRKVTVEDNQIRDGRYGTHFMYAHDATVRRNQLRGNTVGIFVMYSARLLAEDNELSGARGPAGMGIGFKESDAVTLRRNRLVANTVGTYLDFTPRNPDLPVLFEENLFALNGIAIRMHGSERGARFAKNDLLADDHLVEVDGNGDALGVVFAENFWESYAGYDLDRDGQGDVAFQLKQPSSDLKSAHPLLRYFHGTAALALYDALSNALPFFGTRLVLEDPAPRMHPNREVPR